MAGPNAPAADQARLLHDLRAEAERQLLSVTRLDGNRLTGTAHVILLPPGITTRVILRMNVNDEVLEVRVGYDHATTSAAVLGDMLVRQMSEALAARFLYQMLRGVTLPTSEHEVSRTA